MVLLANHGVLVIGESVAHAWYDLYYFERACMAQVLAQSTGQPLRRLSEDLATMAAKQFDEERDDAHRFFHAVRRQVDRALPGYEA